MTATKLQILFICAHIMLVGEELQRGRSDNLAAEEILEPKELFINILQ